MITYCSTSFVNKKYAPVNFKEYAGFTTVHSKNVNLTTNNYTAFMRDYDTLKFSQNYLTKTFPYGAKIAEFGCSTGQKLYSMMIMLDKYNAQNKYKLTGYDFPEVLNNYDGIYGISEVSNYERILFPNYKDIAPITDSKVPVNEAEEIRDTFYKYFENYSPTDDIPQTKREKYQEMIRQNSSVVQLKNNSTAINKVKMKCGDINDINYILPPNSTGMIIFQNALYQILSDGNLFYDKPQNLKKINTLFGKINKVLRNDGIFILGNYSNDHIEKYPQQEETRFIYQNGEKIRVYDSSPIHKLLSKNGFEPIFYEVSSNTANYPSHLQIYVPSVWKKSKPSFS